MLDPLLISIQLGERAKRRQGGRVGGRGRRGTYSMYYSLAICIQLFILVNYALSAPSYTIVHIPY